MRYAALCCIAKDEDLFLHEWVAYHRSIGFEHFIIYDNCSAVPITTLLAPWLSSNTITIVRNSEELTQKIVYDHCLEHFGKNFQWIAFLDVNEFICLVPEDQDIRTFLAPYEPYAGLCLNWRMFSSAEYTTTPAGLVIQNYTKYLDNNIHVKSIVQPHKVAYNDNPHAFMPKLGEYCVNTDFFPIPPGHPFAIPYMHLAYINHYFFKSRECFAKKIAKNNPCNIKMDMKEFEAQIGLPTRTDKNMLLHVPIVEGFMERIPFSAPQKPTETSPQALLATASAYIEEKNYEQARLCLCYTILKADIPEQAVIWAMRSNIARLTEDDALAQHCIKQSLALAPTAQGFLEMAQNLQQHRQLTEANYMLSILQQSK